MAVAVLWAGLACAQANAQQQEPAASPFTLPAVPALPGGDTFVVRRWLFDGNRVVSTAELEAIAAPYLDRPLRAVELEELRHQITRLYVDRGYVSSGAIVPEDAYRDGSLRITLVEGRVARLVTKGMDGLSDAYVAARLYGSDEPVNAKQMQERFQLLLADPLFERMQARLIPGSAPGSSIVDVDVTRARRVQVSAFANNQLAPAIGSTNAGLDFTWRNLTGWGDALDAVLYKSGGSHNVDFGWLIPLLARHTTLAVRVTHGRSSVVEEPLDTLDIDSVVRSREVTLAHPFVNQTNRRLTLGVSFTERRNRVSIGGEPFSFESGGTGEPSETVRVRAWRMFQDLSMRLGRHVLVLRSTFVAGRSNVVADAALPDQASASYRLWQGQAQAALAVGEQGAQWLIRGNLQRSADRLPALERLSVGGRHTVRGYRENQLVRDNGYSISAEYHHPLFADAASSRRRLTLVPFVDLGGGGNRGEPMRRLASAGLGLTWMLNEFEGDIFFAKRLERRAADTHGDLQDRGIHFSLRYRLY